MPTHRLASWLFRQTFETVVGTASLAASAAFAAEPAKITLAQVRVENAVASCMALEPKEIQRSGSTVKLLADARLIKSTGECGCKSALLRYRVYTQAAPGQRVEWHSGAVSAMGSAGSKAFEFVLSSDASIQQRNELILSIGCAASP
jgi:hypothetical protein